MSTAVQNCLAGAVGPWFFPFTSDFFRSSYCGQHVFLLPWIPVPVECETFGLCCYPPPPQSIYPPTHPFPHPCPSSQGWRPGLHAHKGKHSMPILHPRLLLRLIFVFSTPAIPIFLLPACHFSSLKSKQELLVAVLVE